MPQIIDRAKLEAAQKGFRTTFHDALSRAAALYKLMAMVITSSAPVEIYNWLGTLPKMKEWVGDRELAKLKAYDWTVRNLWWANGIEVDRDEITDDKLGLVAPRIRQLASMAEIHKDQKIFDLMVNGFTTACYDGQFFFDTDHQDGSETAQSNKGTAVLAAASYEAAWATMLALTDESGEPLNIRPTHLVVGPSNRATALSILKDERLANGASNRNFGTAELIINPRLVGTHATKWFLLDLSGELKPFLLQIREDVEFAAQDNPEDEHAFMRRVYRYGAAWRGQAAYGLWQFAYGSDGSV